MNKSLSGKKIAVLATDGFEQSELEKPVEALNKAGADTQVVSLKTGKIQGMEHDKKGRTVKVDVALSEAEADAFDALLLPGGMMNPDTLRTNPEAIGFVKAFATAGKPIAAICHAPWLLIEAGLVHGRTLTSWPAIKSDVRNAGGNWVDLEVVEDHGLVTSRSPKDIPAFNERMIALFAGSAQG